MPSRGESATCGWRRRVFHYPPPTLMSRNFRLPCAIELQPLSLTPLKMRKVEISRLADLCGKSAMSGRKWASMLGRGASRLRRG